MRSRGVVLSLLLAVPGAVLPAQAVPAARADTAPADSAVRLMAAAYERATAAPAATRVPLFYATLRLADSLLAAAPARATAAQVYRRRAYAALSLSRALRGAADASRRCGEARTAQSEADSAADALAANVGPPDHSPDLRLQMLTWRLARAERDSAAQLVRRLCTTAAR